MGCATVPQWPGDAFISRGPRKLAWWVRERSSGSRRRQKVRRRRRSRRFSSVDQRGSFLTTGMRRTPVLRPRLAARFPAARQKTRQKSRRVENQKAKPCSPAQSACPGHQTAAAAASASRVRRVISAHWPPLTSALSTIHEPPIAATTGSFKYDARFAEVTPPVGVNFTPVWA